ESGLGEVQWDGTDLNGQPVPEGEYTFEVSAEDVEGNRVQATTRRGGVVDGVTYASGYPELVVDGQTIAVGNVIEVVPDEDDSSTASETASTQDSAADSP
ncbi:MAG: FlgD immunoglobulin-like domain containing protein, partial [Myxococcota bacterium]